MALLLARGIERRRRTTEGAAIRIEPGLAWHLGIGATEGIIVARWELILLVLLLLVRLGRLCAGGVIRLVLGRIVDELPLLDQTAVLVDLDSFAFEFAGDA